MRYRRKVGNGEQCYAKLRDAALQWEKMHEGSHWAGVRILEPKQRSLLEQQQHTTTVNKDNQTELMEDPYAPLPPTVSENVMQIWSHPGGRKLATMSRIGRKLPIWVVNPCVVVYELVDSKAKEMTYSSTAYATLSGHLIAGEEHHSGCRTKFQSQL